MSTRWYTYLCIIVIAWGSFFAGVAVEKHLHGDSFDAARKVCEEEIDKRNLVERFPEINEDIMLEECVKASLKKGKP